MGPIYAMGGQPGATTCIDGRGVGQPARCATLTTVHASPACSGREPHITPPIPRGWSWCTPDPLSTWSACCDNRALRGTAGGGLTS